MLNVHWNGELVVTNTQLAAYFEFVAFIHGKSKVYAWMFVWRMQKKLFKVSVWKRMEKMKHREKEMPTI